MLLVLKTLVLKKEPPMNACIATGLVLVAGSLLTGSPGTFLAGVSVAAFGAGLRMAVGR